VLAAGLVLVLLTAFCLAQARRRPYLLVGWLWYLGTLVPVIGFLQIGQHALADRYTYVPLIGIFLAAVWYAADVTPARWRRPVLVPAAVLVLLLCAAATWRQVGVWHDSITLWERTLGMTQDNYLAHYDLGKALEAAGREDEALDQFLAAVRLRPWDPEAQRRMGQVYLHHGMPRRAVASFRKAAELAPQDSRYRYLEAQALRRLGDAEGAARAEAEGDRLPPPRR
jgi:tetratricopeptide (TPR) repeat protein